ncbi:vWA domain-containing protein [Methylovulum psychrotolerans]|uniref:VWFA domain-containing protein n=1 Tax=Methylovulum psychrotolerans TaxID=1704499 RepID=A0A1Z4C277_9GAMM|nr:vWA domain-containing protein [Methylovulum psychrotolerans]ASF47638.1 hypothetical protein CEK71_17070 [Methylovulum psychrotolerans]
MKIGVTMKDGLVNASALAQLGEITMKGECAMKWLGGVMLGLYVFLGVAQAADSPRKHIRVVLDLSKSMRLGPPYGQGNDPGGMAILSTLLLYDLTRPDIGLHDSFKVIPFYNKWAWQDPAQSPPTNNGPIIEAKLGGAQAFVDAIKSLPYDAECTHFYPGLYEASHDLSKTGKTGDTRTIVLITDGLPDNPCKGNLPTQDEEKRRILQDIVPLMAGKKIRLYVIAFGQSVREDFFAPMTGATGGRVFALGSGETLLGKMLEVFAESLDYEVIGPDDLPKSGLELTQSSGRADNTAVVVFSHSKGSVPAKEPNVTLDPPPNSPANFSPINYGYQRSDSAPSIKQVANSRNGVPGAAYHIDWILNPGPGIYNLDTDPKEGQVAVLRPVSAKFGIVGIPDPAIKATDVMANSPLPLGLAIGNSVEGVLSKDIVVQYRLSATSIGLNPELKQAPSLMLGSKVYTFPEIFAENPKNPADSYVGQIEAWAYHKNSNFENALASLTPPYKVTVHPHLSITPNPSSGDAGTALSRGDHYCTEPFNLEVQGHLPKLNGAKKYTVTANLDFPDATVIEQEFFHAEFSLDGLPLQFNNPKSPASPAYPTNHAAAGEWFKGRALTEAELTGNHTLCVVIGQPKYGDPSKTLTLPLHFVLKHSPYQDVDVIKRYELKLTLAEVIPPIPPSGASLAALGLVLLSLLWLLRGIPKLPPDLAFALATEGGGNLQPKTLGEGSLLQRALGLPVDKPIIAENGDLPLAWVCPVNDELFKLRLGKGVTLTNPEGGGFLPISQGNAVSVSVHRIYGLTRQNRTYRVRLEYRH